MRFLEVAAFLFHDGQDQRALERMVNIALHVHYWAGIFGNLLDVSITKTPIAVAN